VPIIRKKPLACQKAINEEGLNSEYSQSERWKRISGRSKEKKKEIKKGRDRVVETLAVSVGNAGSESCSEDTHQVPPEQASQHFGGGGKSKLQSHQTTVTTGG
jgi:hypothetical protein